MFKFKTILVAVSGAMILLCGSNASAALVTQYTFDGSTKDASNTAANITASIFDSSDGTVDFFGGNPSSGDAIADIGWKGGNYFYFSVTPAEGYYLTLSDLQFDDYKGPGLGDSWEVTYLLGSTGSFSSAGTGLLHSSWSLDTVNFSGVTELQNATDTVTFRILAIGTSNDNKYWYLDNVTLTGEVTTVVPEPATICMLGLGGLGLLRRKRRA